MPGQIVVVKRPRGGVFALVRSVPAWLRAAWRGEALAPSPRSGAARTVPHLVDTVGPSPAAGSGTRSPETTDPTTSAPVGEPPEREEALRAVVAERGATLDRSLDGMDRIEVIAGEATALLRGLREDPRLGFDRLLDLTVVDRIDRGGPLEVVYFLAASAGGDRLRVHAALPSDSPEIATAALLWSAADWLEREAHDLFGVRFRGHPGLRRILLPADFEGAPLRKDFVGPISDAPDALARPEGGTP